MAVDRKEYRRQWQIANRDKRREREQRRRRVTRLSALARYGGACVCCGETATNALCIDHKFGGGTQERRAYKHNSDDLMRLYAYGDWREDLQVLCATCNQAKERGGCDHHEIREVASMIEFLTRSALLAGFTEQQVFGWL